MAKDQTLVLKLAANYVTVDIAGLQASGEFDLSAVCPRLFLDLMVLVHNKQIGSRNAKDFLPYLPNLQGDMQKIAADRGLLQLSNESDLLLLVTQVIQENPDPVAGYKAGKQPLLKFLVGQGMKLSKGAANPQVLEKLFISEINK